MTTFFGLLTASGGLVLLVVWWEEFLLFMKGMLPFSLVFAGVVAMIIGLSGSGAASGAPEEKKDHGKA